MRRPKIKEKVPEYLHDFIATQDGSLYTAIDHASWRYILKVSRSFFAKHAHQKYLDGLQETGINPERIPLVSEMDERLQDFGWRAVPVVGFIPTEVFMEFLSLGVLPIACDMRKLEHLAYTPAPDIVHEAAGHAPIIADPEYADYLFQYGEIARKVIFSKQDMDVYEAVRELSDTKEDPKSTQAQIDEAQAKLDRANAAVDFVSEAAQLARMGWWTIEYGLVGSLEKPKIYGAGLLSSLSESYHCLSPQVKKIPFSVDCVKTSYDITKPQPQLFVTPDFQTLGQALELLAATMAYRRGGLEGLERARKAQTTTTAVLDSGLQMSGRLDEILTDGEGDPCYLRYAGPCQLALAEQELVGHGAEYHAQGYGAPVGRLKGFQGRSAAELSRDEISKLKGRFEFESGVLVEGTVTDILERAGKNLVVTLNSCKVTYKGRVLFDPAWGTFDMSCGSKVISVFGGAADRGKYLKAVGGHRQKPALQKTNLTEENRELNVLYQRVREIREKDGSGASAVGKMSSVDAAGAVAKSSSAGTGAVGRSCGLSAAGLDELRRIHDELEKKYPQDWLLRLELLEFKVEFADQIKARLAAISKRDQDTAEMIARGLAAV
ncbi:MAG: aromatic amino acid hydroxylase [Bdellovibrionota bacterium]